MGKLMLIVSLGLVLPTAETAGQSEPTTSTELIAELSVFEMTDPPAAPSTTTPAPTTTAAPATTTERKDQIICASYTPCKWIIFLHNPERDAWIMPMFQIRTRNLPNELYEKFMVRDQDVINKYCVCGPGTVCTRMEIVTYSGYEVFRCRPGTK